MRRAAAAAIVLLASGCARDVSLPAPPPPPGKASLSGRIVYAQPGTAARLPAFGARVELLGTGRVTFADADGKFLLAELDVVAGQLLAQFDPGGTGVPSRQRVLDLGAFAGRAGVDLSVGDLLVNENARVRGRALRGDAAGSGGHAGTIIYVPQGPFTTFTNDDGSFELRDLPEGSLDVAAFRTGYESVTVAGLALRAAEDLSLRDLVLPVLTGGGTGDPGAVRGRVVLDPVAAGTTSARRGTGGRRSSPT